MTHSSTHHIRPNSMVLYNHMIVSYILEALNKKRVYTTEVAETRLPFTWPLANPHSSG